MKRNLNIDLVRAIAIILVIVYHIFEITGVSFKNGIIQEAIAYGGEIGVTIFFILSGFSIYTSINNKKDNFKYQNFLFKRLKRILPQYYISIIFILLFTASGAAYLGNGAMYNLFSHAFLFHSNYPSINGAINGVLWTLSVIFEFYLISPILYKCVEKFPKLTLILSFIFSITVKAFLYHFIFASRNAGLEYYFALGKSIFCTIDIFVIGMILGKIIKITENNKNIIFNIFGIIVGLIIIISLMYIQSNNISILTQNKGLYSDSFTSYFWHDLLALGIALSVYFFSKIKFNFDNIISKMLLFISKYEYGIYIWHLILIVNLYNNSQYIQNLATAKRKLTYVILFLLSIASGAIISEIIDNIDFKKIYSKFENIIKSIMKISIIFLTVVLIYKNVKLTTGICNGISNISNDNVKFETPSLIIANNAINKIEEDKKYLYIDSRETGYLYFFTMRYFLSPRKTVHYMEYDSIINDTSVEQIYEYLKNVDVDYYIIKDCPILEQYFNYDYNDKIGQIYKKNVNATSIDDLFIEVK